MGENPDRVLRDENQVQLHMKAVDTTGRHIHLGISMCKSRDSRTHTCSNMSHLALTSNPLPHPSDIRLSISIWTESSKLFGMAWENPFINFPRCCCLVLCLGVCKIRREAIIIPPRIDGWMDGCMDRADRFILHLCINLHASVWLSPYCWYTWIPPTVGQ